MTEADKVALFTEQFQIPPSCLPQRRYAATGLETADTSRYFVHKLPIFVAGDPPIPHLVWLETDARTKAAPRSSGTMARCSRPCRRGRWSS